MGLLALDLNNLNNKYSMPPDIHNRYNIKQDDLINLDRSEFESKSEIEDIYQSEDGKFVSEKEYWDDYYEHPDFKYEWVNGILKEKEMPEIRTYNLESWLESIFKEYLKVNPIGLFAVSEIGFKMTLEDKSKSSIRKPDFALILNNNSVHPESTDKSYKGIFDFCVEYLSDSKQKYVDNDTIDKKKEYAEAGVKEYYIIDIKKENTVFYTLNEKTKTYNEIETIDGVIHSKVLPGFKFRVDDLYLQPDLEELIDDDVYKSYVLLNYQSQCQKAKLEKIAREQVEKEKEQVEKEKEQVEKEKKQALKNAETEKVAREQVEKEKKQALKNAETEKVAREQVEKEKDRVEKEKEQAEKEIERLLQIMNERGINI